MFGEGQTCGNVCRKGWQANIVQYKVVRVSQFLIVPFQQVDNQLLGAQCPIVLYVTPQSKNDETRYLPAIYLTAHQLLSSCTNSYIFKVSVGMMHQHTLAIIAFIP